jgi:hypothetical protein
MARHRVEGVGQPRNAAGAIARATSVRGDRMERAPGHQATWFSAKSIPTLRSLLGSNQGEENSLRTAGQGNMIGDHEQGRLP